MRNSARHIMLLSLAIALGASAGACRQRARSVMQRPTQGAVSTAMQRVQNTVASAVDPRGLESVRTADGSTLPAIHIEGLGLGAHPLVLEDTTHQNVTALRTDEGWAVAWNDGNRARAFMAQLDPQGQPMGAPVLLRESRSDEEDVVAPSVAFNGSEFGVAWVDTGNGRVEFKRFSRDGRALGRASIVHDGLEMPQASRIAWNGSEYGVVVALPTGVYFTRVSRDGQRIGGGVMVADGPAVGGLDELTASQNGFQVAWHESGEGQNVRHEARITRDGQVLGALSARGSARFAAR